MSDLAVSRSREHTSIRAQRRTFGLVFSCLLLALVLGPTSAAVGEEYSTEYLGQCCYETIESGAIEKQFFIMRNTGTATWGAPGAFSINLGTDAPRDRASAFQAPDWPGANRVTVGVKEHVPPGSSYKFVFDIQAPLVSQPTSYVEAFGLVAESFRWLDAAEGLGPLLSLDYTVLPASPPTLTLSLSRTSLIAGESLTASAEGTAIASLNHIDIHFAGQEISNGPPRSPEIAYDEQPSWTTSGTLTTSGLGSGPQTVVATAYDDAGLSTTTTATVEVSSPPPPPPPPPPPLAPHASVAGQPRMYFAGTTLLGRRGQLRLARVVILGMSPGERVFASCHACKGKAKLGPKIAHGSQVTLTPKNLIVTGRSKIVVYVAGAGIYGRYKVYAIDVAKATATPKQQGCLTPGSTTHVTCP
ncbi:MAG TPA: hypothetical protein VMB05_17460 [Solirubrobacteraceae bacterium]|nr:hypothetical protein [Solirubrobacteraceae bacterium]